jgi:septal ring factor EnvC (AmiA/AmiB activator)
MAKKSNIRSIRFSDEIIKIIEAQEGETFTANFESLIKKCYQEIPAKEKELEYVKQSIDNEYQRLRRIQKRAGELEQSINSMAYTMQTYNSQVKRAVQSLEKLLEET